MKATDFNKLTTSKLEKIPTPELKKLVSEQGQISNKRYYRIKGSSKTAKNAVRSVDATGGKFSVKGKNTTQELILEAKRIQRFNTAKTGTYKGAVESKKNYEKAYKGKTAKQVGKEAEKKYKREKMEEEKKKASAKGKKVSKTTRKKIEREARKKGKEAEKNYSKEAEDSLDRFEDDLNEEIDKMACGTNEIVFMNQATNMPRGMSKDDFDSINEMLGGSVFV